MSPNSVIATVEFYFQGERFAPSMTIDLDACMRGEISLAELYPVLAESNGIDTYSYMYEVMESESIRFSEATGLAAGFVRDGRLDIEGFAEAWRQQQALETIRPIAKAHLDIDRLEEYPGLLQALAEAYQAGVNAGTNQAERG